MGLLSLALVREADRDAYNHDYIRSGGIVPIFQTPKYEDSSRILVYDGFVVYANDYVPILNYQVDFEGEGHLYKKSTTLGTTNFVA